MKNETKKRIKEYRKRLPRLKEKVVACALLFAMSAAMLTTVSFAWLIRSTSPEMSGATVTITANGNLEIALSNTYGSLPSESMVGDGIGDLIEKNLKWGNIVNLSDESYGLGNLALRPAMLNENDLANNPLFGAKYDSSGRIENYITNFGYTKWNPPTDTVPEGAFVYAPDHYGVRAISSLTIKSVGADAIWQNFLDDISSKHAAATSAYKNIVGNTQYQTILAEVMGKHMTAILNKGDIVSGDFDENGNYVGNSKKQEYVAPQISNSTMRGLGTMCGDLIAVYVAEADAMAALLNARLFYRQGADNYTDITGSKILDNTFNIESAGITDSDALSALDDFRTSYQNIVFLKTNIDNIIENNANAADIGWKNSGMQDAFMKLIDIDKCLVKLDSVTNGKYETVTKFLQLISDMQIWEMTGLSGAKADVIINNGVLYELECQLGEYLKLSNLSVKAGIWSSSMNNGVSASMNVSAVTDASLNSTNYFENDFENLKGINDGKYQGGEKVASDTYALAVDFWVRTNAPNSYLTLGGNLLTKTEELDATVIDPIDGKSYNVYVFTVTGTNEDGEEVPQSFEIYGKPNKDPSKPSDSAPEKWYNAITYEEFTIEDYTAQDISEKAIPKKVKVTTVIGYEGDNRIWDKNDLLDPENAATQGVGSCYTFFYNSVEQRSQILSVLEYMKIAFVDDSGNLLAIAKLDTVNYYDGDGKIILPMVLDASKSTSVDNVPVITSLEKNVATRITAIIYIDGLGVKNEHVLSNADIQGDVNFQFKNTADLDPMGDQDLQAKTVKATASLSGNSKIDYAENLTVPLSVVVEGYEPQTVQAYFVRSLNAAQGVKAQTVSLTKSNNQWTCDYPFNAPGKYVLSSVLIDGIRYEVDTPVEIEVTGAAITSVYWGVGGNKHVVNVWESSNTFTTDISVGVASTVYEITKVRAIFVDTNDTKNSASATLTRQTDGTWSGKITFHKSGNYVLEFISMNDIDYPVQDNFKKYANLSLGIRAEVFTTEKELQIKYEKNEMIENGQDILDVQVKLFDNNDDQITALTNATLVYHIEGKNGSSVKEIDTDLKYNAEKKYYEGELNAILAGAGKWTFKAVTIGEDGHVGYATSSPSFTLISPEPPEYVDGSYGARSYYYIPEWNATNNASVWLEIANTEAATAKAIFSYVGEDGKEYESYGDGSHATSEDSNIVKWTFEIPAKSENSHEGNWRLERVELSNVYDSSGKLYTADDPMIIDGFQSETNYGAIKVVEDIYVTYTYGNSYTQDIVFGKSGDTVTGVFMQEHTLPSGTIEVEIKDFEGKSIEGIDSNNVKLIFVYIKGTSKDNGGYESAHLSTEDPTPIKFSVSLQSSNGKNFQQSEAVKFQYAGSYVAQLNFNVETKPVSNDNLTKQREPSVNVFSIKPTVAITAISPTGNINIDPDNNVNKHTSITVPAFTETNATVYFKCGASQSGSGSTCSPVYHNYTRPSVTITLAGIGNASQADLTFGTDVHIYNGTSKTTGYTWTANGTCARNIGYFYSRTASTDDKAAAGTLTCSTLTLTYYDGNTYTTYTVTIPTITISNPY